jgi:hypothetical protein
MALESKRNKAGLYDRLICTRWAKGALFLALMAGLLILLLYPVNVHPYADTSCTLRHFTGIPCPGCGMGRGLHLLLTGHWGYALWMNPFSVVVLLGTVWIMGTAAYDVARGTQHTPAALSALTHWGQRLWWVWAPLLLLNWLWNIDKFA